jgi:tetratricopeptide (TPR) repeat protein
MNTSLQNIILIAFLTLSLTSCSWISSGRSLFGEEEETAKKAPESVPRGQYDELMEKYKILLEEKKMERVETVGDANNFANEMEASAALKQLSQVSAEGDKPELSATVDLFKESREADQRKVNMPKAQSYSKGLVDEHVNKIRSVERLVSQNKIDPAIKLLKELEMSPVRQVAVRARFYLGEILFKQQEYDLALQVYEDILKKNAFSGLVIISLGRLIVCSEKLKIKSKKEKYYSMLHDFFEQG